MVQFPWWCGANLQGFWAGGTRHLLQTEWEAAVGLPLGQLWLGPSLQEGDGGVQHAPQQPSHHADDVLGGEPHVPEQEEAQPGGENVLHLTWSTGTCID